MRIIALLFTIIVFCAAASFVIGTADDEKKVCLPFSQITSITFTPGMTTTRRRTPNQPRMSCIGNCPQNAEVSSAQCKQQGLSDNGLPTWKCLGSFIHNNENSDGAGDNHQYRLGNVRVSCEGCTKSGDSDVVAGSCSLKYSIESKMRHRRGRRNTGGSSSYHSSSTTTSHYADNSLSLMDLMVIIMVCVGTCYCCSAIARERARRRHQNDHDHDHIVEGVPMDNKTAHNNQQQGSGGVHHHHYGNSNNNNGGGGFFGGGGNGFFSGMLLGSIMSGGMYGGGSHTTINNNIYDDGDSGFGGGGGDSDWGGGGGFGDSISD